MIPPWRLCPAAAGDAQALARLDAEVFGSQAWSESLLAHAIAGSGRAGDGGPLTSVVLARDDSQILGYIVTSAIIPEGSVDSLAVAAHARRHGIGAALLDRGLADARARGVSEVYLEVRAGNTPAIGLYRSRGFTRFALRRNYYSHPLEDAWCMRTRLGVGAIGVETIGEARPTFS